MLEPMGESDQSAVSVSEPAAHVLDAPFPEPEAAQPISADAPAGEPAPAGVLSRDEFFVAFKAILALPGNVSPHVGGPELKSLAVKPDEEAAARSCSDAIYDTAAEVPFLRWMIEPGSKWVARIMAIGMFAAPKGLAVLAELREQRKAARRPPAALGAEAAAADVAPRPAAPAHVDGQALNAVPA